MPVGCLSHHFISIFATDFAIAIEWIFCYQTVLGVDIYFKIVEVTCHPINRKILLVAEKLLILSIDLSAAFKKSKINSRINEKHLKASRLTSNGSYDDWHKLEITAM